MRLSTLFLALGFEAFVSCTPTIQSVDIEHDNFTALDGLDRGVRLDARQTSGYWLANMNHGIAPFASIDYPVWRNVKDFGAKGDGVTDDTKAIQLAVSSNGRCGFGCNATSALGAIVYFPAGTYMVSAPIMQYYFTQFIGDPTADPLPTIKGMPNFAGIALIDTDQYIPGGNGQEWYINQNQFYRQIRNFNIDLTAMPNSNTANGQNFVPTGIHWQVAQATSLQNLNFNMIQGSTAVGIFTENGSGGFMSDLTFFGGNIGMNVGSQQFTARNLFFNNPVTAVKMIWDWGWTWQNIVVESAFKAFDCTAFGGPDSGTGTGGDGPQGTGSITILDSHFINVPFAILVPSTFNPAITIDNLLIEGNTEMLVLVDGGATLLEGTTGPAVTITSWAMGRRYTSVGDTGTDTTGNLSPIPNKPAGLIDPATGFWYTRSRPQYETLSASNFLNAVSLGAVNDGTGDQSSILNSIFQSGASSGNVVFLPAGIYAVASTVTIPNNCKVVGEAWSQIMATGANFNDWSNPIPVVRVGNPGDVGEVEISDLLFTTKGNTAGAIMVEWNVHESGQGDAGMWDSHIRVGGQAGSNLTLANCPISNTFDPACSGAAMLMHVASGASAYFENNWLWVADHDIDDPLQTQINVFSARGLLVESTAPVWFWGSASEHSYFYQYQLLGANEVFLGHMQTESPYYAPTPDALGIIQPGTFPGDPTFADCNFGDEACLSAWALLITNSTDVFIYGAGLYSWYVAYDQSTCLMNENCQQRLVQTDFSEGIWIYSQFTKGVTECISPLGGVPVVQQADNRNGFLTAITAWIPLALTGSEIGGITPPVDNPSPNDLPPVGGLASACGDVQCGQTMTLSSQCASAIAALPTSGANNNPPNDNCQETCDIFRLITGTCCGNGGSACFGIELPPGEPVPAPFPITIAPPPSVTWSVEGFDSTGMPTTQTYGGNNEPTVFPIVIPPPWVPIPPLGPPIIIPPGGDLPDEDPPSFIFVVQTWDDDSWEDTDPDFVPPPEPGSGTGTTPTPPPANTPAPSNGNPAVWSLIFWSDSVTGTSQYEGFDLFVPPDSNPFPDPCITNNPTWSTPAGDSVPSRLTGIVVFGDFCVLDGLELTCDVLSPAHCTNGFGDNGGTCLPTQNWDTLVSCTWS